MWRTRGGVYTESQGRAGKSTSLRISPHGVNIVGPEPVVCYEAIHTCHGRRYRKVDSDNVRSGMQLHLQSLRGLNLTLSTIQDAYSGVRVAEILTSDPHIVTTEDQAWLLRDGDRDRATPLLAEGWTGNAGSLPDISPKFILRVDRSSDTPESQFDWVDRNAPGWAPLVQAMSKHLAAENVDIRISHAEFDIDGGLSIRLADVPLLGDGRPAESIESNVREAEALTRRTCQMCGDLALAYGEPGQVPFVQRVMCFDHKTETETADPPAQTGTGLPRHLRNDRVRVEPGWYPIILELDQEITRVSGYLLESCTQDRGWLKFVPSFPEVLPHDAARRVRQLIYEASMRAETTCEHCGKAGARIEEPWIHVCCQTCSNAETSHGDAAE